MKAQLKTLLTSFLLLIALCFGAFASVCEKHAVGDFAGAQQHVGQNPEANQLASLESFGFYQKHASECCNATNRTLPSNYRDLGDGWVSGLSGGKAWDTGYAKNGQPVYQREGGGYYTIGSDGKQVTTGSPKPHGNTLDNTPTEIYQRVNDLDGSYQKVGISNDAHRRYAEGELGLDRIDVVGTRPRDQAAKVERFIAERWPGPLNKEPWAGARNPSHPNYDPNYIPAHLRGN